MLLLERIGIFSVDVYRKNRRYAVVIIVVAAAVITPTGDPFTLSLLAIPMYALYELGIWMIPQRAPTDVPASMAR
jgi:sec-independent protein translocase protein TatC